MRDLVVAMSKKYKMKKIEILSQISKVMKVPYINIIQQYNLSLGAHNLTKFINQLRNKINEYGLNLFDTYMKYRFGVPFVHIATISIKRNMGSTYENYKLEIGLKNT